MTNEISTLSIITKLYLKIHRDTKYVFDQHDSSSNEYLILCELRKGSFGQRELVRATQLGRTAIRTCLKTLKTKGYINLTPGPKDGDICEITLTKKGITFISKLHTDLIKIDDIQHEDVDLDKLYALFNS